MERCSRVHARHLVEWAKDKPEVLVLSADLTSSTEVDLFRDAYPDRFISAGIAEQNMVSVAGGLAREGYIPFVHTFAVFLYRRACDQIAMSVAYPNLPVKLFGFLPGITTPGGATHQAIEDIAVMRLLPNMTVFECGDATEVESVLDAAIAVNGPVYVRMIRGDIPRLFDADKPFVCDKPRVLRKGADVAVFSSGICTEEVMRVIPALEKRGVAAAHIHMSTFKPCKSPIVTEAIAGASYGVVTVENHLTNGGLATLVAERMVECGTVKRLLACGIRDTFSHGGGRAYLMKEHGLDASAVIRAVETLVGRPLDIPESEISAGVLPDTPKGSPSEAL
ncbi:MAG: transketolase [Spirochaetales bacterium]|nr:transketolase [Spirochaetales bacterium]